MGRGKRTALLACLASIAATECSGEMTAFCSSVGSGIARGSMASACKASSRAGSGALLGLRAQRGPQQPQRGDDIERLLSPFGEWGKKVGRSVDWFFDTSDVAGAKAWRLQMPPGEADAQKWRSGDMLEELLQDQIDSQRKEGKEKAYASGPGGSLSEVAQDNVLGLGSDEDYFDGPSEYSMTDEDLGDALRKRFDQISRGERLPFGQQEDLTGMELAEMCVAKYGVAYDMAMKCDKLQLVSDQKLVSLNLYYAYYGQLNPEFPYTDEEYLSRLDALASLINQWNQQEFVRDFFREKPTAYRGLPSRPRWDTAVSIRLSRSPTWNPALSDDFFWQ